MTCTYVTKTWTENTGGGCMVDFIQLDDGRVITVNDESLAVWQSVDAFYKAAEGYEGQCEMHHWFTRYEDQK